MSHTTRSLFALIKASMKMYYRNKGAIVFSLLLPMALMSIFGFLSKGSGPSIKVEVTNHASSKIAAEFLEILKKVDAIKLSEVSEQQASEDLSKGNIDLQVIIPAEFGTEVNGQPATGNIQTRFNKAKPQGGQIANLIIVEIISNLNRKITNTPVLLDVRSEAVVTHELNYFDFILPGILSMTIMQLGIFGVAFSFVAMKASGTLRRIQATPVHPFYFLLAQCIVRLSITLMSAAILLIFGIQLFDFHMLGNYLSFALVAVMGIFIFLGIGFSIAGWARDETQVAPVANLIQLPLLLLSGIFFSREGFPAWLKSITDYFPLTYLSHGLRKIANEGATLVQIGPDLLGMTVWLIIIYAIAVKLFRWE
jgi:ABC-2 type transport system permease protein